MNKLTEKQLHKQICDYIKLQYPKVLFNTDMSGIKLTIGQAIQAKKLRSGNGFPDIIIYESNKNFNALFLEVKKETPFKKDGNLKKSKHLEEQDDIHLKLWEKGYKASFVWSFDMAKEIIDNYLN
jgi:hypothetical protein